MGRYAIVLAVLAVVQPGSIGNAAAEEENPVVRALVREVARKELSVRDSKEKGWHHGNTWIWLDKPSANLAVDITNLTLDDAGRLAVEGRAAAMLDFDHKVALPIGSKTFGGQVRVYITFKASTVVGEQLTGSKVSIGRLEIHELRLRGDAGRAFQGVIQDGVNLVLKHKKHDIERQLEEALNKAKSVREKKGSGTVVRSTLRAVPATVPDPFFFRTL